MIRKEIEKLPSFRWFVFYTFRFIFFSTIVGFMANMIFLPEVENTPTDSILYHVYLPLCAIIGYAVWVELLNIALELYLSLLYRGFCCLLGAIWSSTGFYLFSTIYMDALPLPFVTYIFNAFGLIVVFPAALCPSLHRIKNDSEFRQRVARCFLCFLVLGLILLALLGWVYVLVELQDDETSQFWWSCLFQPLKFGCQAFFRNNIAQVCPDQYHIIGLVVDVFFDGFSIVVIPSIKNANTIYIMGVIMFLINCSLISFLEDRLRFLSSFFGCKNMVINRSTSKIVVGSEKLERANQKLYGARRKSIQVLKGSLAADDKMNRALFNQGIDISNSNPESTFARDKMKINVGDGHLLLRDRFHLETQGSRTSKDLRRLVSRKLKIKKMVSAGKDQIRRAKSKTQKTIKYAKSKVVHHDDEIVADTARIPVDETTPSSIPRKGTNKELQNNGGDDCEELNPNIRFKSINKKAQADGDEDFEKDFEELKPSVRFQKTVSDDDNNEEIKSVRYQTRNQRVKDDYDGDETDYEYISPKSAYSDSIVTKDIEQGGSIKITAQDSQNITLSFKEQILLATGPIEPLLISRYLVDEAIGGIEENVTTTSHQRIQYVVQMVLINTYQDMVLRIQFLITVGLTFYFDGKHCNYSVFDEMDTEDGNIALKYMLITSAVVVVNFTLTCFLVFWIYDYSPILFLSRAYLKAPSRDYLFLVHASILINVLFRHVVET